MIHSSSALRTLSVDMISHANSGHPGLPLGMSDVVYILFKDFLSFDPQNPSHPLRDHFILSAGHGSALLYSLLYLTGYEKPTLDDLKNFRQIDSCAAGHPEYGEMPGIEATTGPLGQGMGMAVGIAYGKKIQSISSKTYVLASDGDLMEGISYEALSFAGHNNLSNLVVLWDNNHITIDGKISLSSSEDQKKRMEACGFDVLSIDGHDEKEIYNALNYDSNKPLFIDCQTIIGKGSVNENTSKCHGSPLKSEDIFQLKEKLNMPQIPFEIPKELYKKWQNIAQNGKLRLKKRGEYKHTVRSDQNIQKIFTDLKNTLEIKKEASRQTSFRILEKIAPFIPNFIGGSADLTPSNNTKVPSLNHYVHYGIREHAMAAIMNGLALCGMRPYGGTFLTFSDYLRPALRLSSIMKLPVIYIFTHDSIGVGEDGPTHQPVEHLASLRAMKNLYVLRPADIYETIECFEIALNSQKTPSALILSRQNINIVRENKSDQNLSSKGGYIFKEAKNFKPQVILLGTGTEIQLCLEIQEELEKQNIMTRVVSLVCFSLFDEQEQSYKKMVLGGGLRVGIEAACSFGWHKYIGENGLFFGVDEYGKSGKAEDIYKKFNLKKEYITKNILKKINN